MERKWPPGRHATDSLRDGGVGWIGQGPAHWDMILTIAEPGDPEDDPTILWPANRKELKVGTLTIASATSEKQAGSYGVNFDPLMLDDGVAATNDPVLLFRSASYAVSHTRRLLDV